MAQAPLGIYMLTKSVLSALTRRHDLPAEFGGWMTSIKAGLEPSWDELARAAAKRPAPDAYTAAGQFGNDGAPVNLQDILFVIHTLHHFLEQHPVALSKPVRSRALGSMVKLIKVYLFFLECLPTIQEQKSVLLDTFIQEYGDVELKSLQRQHFDNDDTIQSVIQTS